MRFTKEYYKLSNPLIIKTQKQLDGLIKNGFEGLIIIEDNSEIISVNENGKARIDVYGNGRVEYVGGNGRVGSVGGNGRVGTVYENGRVEYVGGNGRVEIYSGKIIKAHDNSIIVCWNGYKPTELKKEKSVQIIHTQDYQEVNFSIKKFLDKYNVEKLDTRNVIFYKSVKGVGGKYVDFFTGKVEYKIGKWIKAPDWDDEFNGECGHGLHLSPTPIMALDFNVGGVVLKCKVRIADCKTVKSPQLPIKIRCKKVFPIEVCEERF